MPLKPPRKSKRVIALAIVLFLVAVKQFLLSLHVDQEIITSIGNLFDAATGLAAALGVTAYGLEYRSAVKQLMRGDQDKAS